VRAAGSSGQKKTAGFAGGFSGISCALGAPSLLSIRQGSEMPEKVKVKLGGHDGEVRCVENVIAIYTPTWRAWQSGWVKNADNPHISMKMCRLSA
jgi:hypothetical protein